QSPTAQRLPAGRWLGCSCAVSPPDAPASFTDLEEQPLAARVESRVVAEPEHGWVQPIVNSATESHVFSSRQPAGVRVGRLRTVMPMTFMLLPWRYLCGFMVPSSKYRSSSSHSICDTSKHSRSTSQSPARLMA